MKKNVLIMTLCAAAIMAGCEKETPAGSGIPMTEDGTAYLAVKICSEPGTKGTDGGFEYGSDNEHAVTSADFYFYDESGAFVAQAQAWNGGGANTADPATNIEFTGRTVVMLKGLKERAYPKYVVTVLNKPSGFTPAENLLAMEEQLVNSFKSGENFIMTTTSYGHEVNYVGAEDQRQPVYFATEVKDDNFIPDPNATITNPVIIYVERLAAKVSLRSSLKPVAGTDNEFEVEVTVAGDPNAGQDAGAEKLRIRIDGWGLNATAKESHIVKKINPSWSELDTFPNDFAWNESGNFRSLWGMGTAYDKDYDTDETYKTYLNYNKLSEMSVAFGTDIYCAENTNTAARVDGHIGSAVTSAMIKATVLHNVKGSWVAADMVRYSGVLYNAEDFKAYAMKNLNVLGKLNYYTKTTDTENNKVVYTQIQKSDVEVVFDGTNSKVKLVVTEEAQAKEWYLKDTDTKADISLLGTELAPFTGNGYKGGEMYYNIPIEHLYENDDEGIEEGNYGIVRNHHYVLTINKISQLGTGVWNPDGSELPIVPEDPDDDLYQVGVTINVLSWRIVNQNVEL